VSTFRRNPNFVPGLRALARVRIADGVEAIRQAIVQRMDRPGTSKPGESPTTTTGEMASRFRTYEPRDLGDSIEAAAGADAPTLVGLMERGTARMAPRPLMLPALLDSKPAVMRAMTGQGVADA
jgi:hypothetical protein